MVMEAMGKRVWLEHNTKSELNKILEVSSPGSKNHDHLTTHYILFIRKLLPKNILS